MNMEKQQGNESTNASSKSPTKSKKKKKEEKIEKRKDLIWGTGRTDEKISRKENRKTNEPEHLYEKKNKSNCN